MNAIRPWLWVGDLADASDRAALVGNRIDAVLQLHAAVRHAGIVCRLVRISDGAPFGAAPLRRGMHFVRTQHAQGRAVLVSCQAGISRSVTFAVAALHEAEGLSLLDALSAVLQTRPTGSPHPALWSSLCSYYGTPYSSEELWQVVFASGSV